MIAKSVAYVIRIASVTMLPTCDSHRRPSALPHASARGIGDGRVADHCAEDRRQLGVELVDPAWMAGSGVTPIVHGLWKSAVL